jgi:hypothetical protein
LIPPAECLPTGASLSFFSFSPSLPAMLSI